MSEPSRPEPVDPFVLQQYARETAARAERFPVVAEDAGGADPATLERLTTVVTELAPELVAASHDLAAHPEVGFEEHRSAALLADLVEDHGIAVERGAYGLETALAASIGTGPTVAILSEYDALPGVGHGCGHNVIATAGLGAFLALATLGDDLPGRVVWLGTPAEEGGSGKEHMARAGAFDDVDAAVMVHPFTFDLAETVFLGRRQLRVRFTGIPAHASAQPFMGRNALDAVTLTYTGIGLHRQQLPPGDRVHAVIAEGGDRPNVIPERAELLVYLRSAYPGSLRTLSGRLADIARGAALMTGCGVELIWDEQPPYLPLRTNPVLARRWNARYAARGHTLLAPDVVPASMAASTDFGNVSYRVPGLHAMVKIAGPELSLHTREFAAAAVGERADAVIADAAWGLAAVALDYLSDADVRDAVDEGFATAGGALDVPTFFD